VQGEVESVKLQRMSNSMITDKRNMFELLTKILDRARKDRDAELVTYVEQATELWTAMMMEECDHDQKCIKNVHDMKDVCDAWLKELLSILEGGSAEAFEREKQTQKQAQGMKVAELEQEVKRMEGLMQESEKAPVSSRDAEQRCASLEEKLQDLERALAQASEALEREKQTQGMKVAELEQEVKRMEGLMQESEKASVSSRDAEQRCASLEEKLQDRERALAQASEALEREQQTQGMKVAELEQEVKRVEGLMQESEKAPVSSRDAEHRYASLEEKLQDLERALAQASEAFEREKQTQGMKVAELEQELKQLRDLKLQKAQRLMQQDNGKEERMSVHSQYEHEQGKVLELEERSQDKGQRELYTPSGLSQSEWARRQLSQFSKQRTSPNKTEYDPESVAQQARWAREQLRQELETKRSETEKALETKKSETGRTLDEARAADHKFKQQQDQIQLQTKLISDLNDQITV
jgi:DNA repair exonuclease SbcCD ATPase subunit